jgi:hypothetical protein
VTPSILISTEKMHTRVLVRCKHCPIRPSALPLNITYDLLLLPMKESYIISSKPHAHILLRLFQNICPCPRPCVIFRNMLSLYREILLSAQPPSWRTTPFLLSATVCSIHSQPLHIWSSYPSAPTGSGCRCYKELT